MGSESNLQKIINVVTVVTLYWIVSISLVFLNKYLLSSDELKLDAPIFVTWFQCVVTILLCALLSVLSTLFPDKVTFPQLLQFDMAVAIKVLPLSAIFVAMILFNNLCLKHLGVAFYYVGRSLTTVFNVVCTYAILKQHTSLKVIICCAIIIGGFFFGVDEEGKGGSLSVKGVAFGVLASLSVALNAIFTKKILPVVDDNITKLLFYNNINAAIIFLPLIAFSGEVSTLSGYPNLTSLSFWSMMTVSGFFGFGIGYVTGWQIQVIGPLSHNISGTAKACFQTILATIYFQQTKVFNWWLSNFIVLGGSFAYTVVKYYENMEAQKNRKAQVLPVDAPSSADEKLLSPATDAGPDKR